jgi:hypothetical protein
MINGAQMYSDSPLEQEERNRFEQVRNSIAKRLKKACAHLPSDEFEALVEKIARVQIGKRYSP